LSSIDLEYDNKKPVRNYSLGMTQRLKLAMALLEMPDILVLDEPLNGLDPDGIADLRKLLIKLNQEKGITIIISSHILSELEQIAVCFGILHDGKIVKEFYSSEVIQEGKTLEELYMQYTRGA
jgi:ABC-type multidrug transport system ATPase subunit